MRFFRGKQSTNTPAAETPSDAGGREFFAFKAARMLGGAARQVGASIAKAVTGQTAEALRSDVEKRVCGSREGFTSAVSEWARLLAATDDTPRYESGDGTLLTFRAAFLQSRAFELALATMDDGSEGTAQSSSLPPDTAGSASRSSPPASWTAFLQGATLAGGESPAAKFPQLFCRSRPFPDCRNIVQELAFLLKADAREEQLRTARAEVGLRAEEINARLRAARGTCTRTSDDALDSSCQESAKAVELYATFRSGLSSSATHLTDALASRMGRLRAARQTLGALDAEAAKRKQAAEVRCMAAKVQCEEASAGARQAVEDLTHDDARAVADQRINALEEDRRRLQLQLESVSQELAAKRDARMALHRRREEAVSEHRRRAQVVERGLLDLRPSEFHRVLAAHADAMTEGEIVRGLAASVDTVDRHVEAARRAIQRSAPLAPEPGMELSARLDAVRGQGRVALREHAKLELARLDAAQSVAEQAVTALAESANGRATRLAMGLSVEAEGYSNFSDFREVKRLRRALRSAEEAWSEAAGLWGGEEAEEHGTVALLAPEGDVPDVVKALEASRGRLAQSLVRLQQADPITYEMAMQDGDTDATELLTDALPHGWEAHNSSEGHAYFFNPVSQASQWEVPTDDAAVSAGWRLAQADGGQWFYHNPYDDAAGIWWPELPTSSAMPADAEILHRDACA